MTVLGPAFKRTGTFHPASGKAWAALQVKWSLQKEYIRVLRLEVEEPPEPDLDCPKLLAVRSLGPTRPVQLSAEYTPRQAGCCREQSCPESPPLTLDLKNHDLQGRSCFKLASFGVVCYAAQVKNYLSISALVVTHSLRIRPTKWVIPLNQWAISSASNYYLNLLWDQMHDLLKKSNYFPLNYEFNIVTASCIIQYVPTFHNKCSACDVVKTV